MKLLIGISGKLGSGKDFINTNVIIPVLEKLQKKYLHINFADQIKINVMIKNGINYTDVYEMKTEHSRQLLQKEGTDIGRTFDKNIWVNYLDNWINVYNNRNISTFVISDCRFTNEFEYVKNSGGIMIKVIAPERNNKRLLQESNGNKEIYNKISTHRSECDLDLLTNDKFDMIIYNDVKESLDINKLQLQFESLLIVK